MTALYIISFILLVVATFALLKLTPEQINRDINELFNKQQTLKDQALTARGKKKQNRILVEMERMRRALQETGKEKQFSVACAAALLLMVAGCIVAIAIDNMFLIPVLAVAFALIPFAYLTKTISIYETQVSFLTLWMAAHQASLPITNSQSSLKLMSIESVMPSSHLILCRPLLLLP